MGNEVAAGSDFPRAIGTIADGRLRLSGGGKPARVRRGRLSCLIAFGLISHSIAEPSTAPPDPLLPLIHRVESFLRRQESSGVTMDPRFSLNPTEVARLTVVCQLLGYADLHLATQNRAYLDKVVSRADFLVDHFGDVASGTVFDGMLGYALLCAYELTGNERHFAKGATIAERVKGNQGAAARLNWGMMAGMCLAKYYDLTGDPTALDRVRSLVSGLPGAQNADGSFPHYCPATSDVHYTGWLAMELIVVRRFVEDDVIDGVLERVNDFLRSRVDSTGNTHYGDCRPGSGDSDGDGVPEETDLCPGTPGGCAVDWNGCEIDVDEDQTCDQGCLSDEDLDGACDGYDRCPDTPRGCGINRFGCDADLDGDGDCDPELPSDCSIYYSVGSGCRIDYDTRGWINELGYSAMVFDRFGEPDYHAVMGFLYQLTDHGTVADKWDYFPPPSDAIYAWASQKASVMRTSVVFWSLAEIYRARAGRMSVRLGDERRIGIRHRAPISLPAVASLRGYLTVDSLVAQGVNPQDVETSPGEHPVPTQTGSVSLFSVARGDSESSGGAVAFASPASPAGSRAVIRFRLLADVDVLAGVFDLSGRRVTGWTLGHLSPGVHELVWDCRDRAGHRVPPGLYWIRVRAGSRSIATGRWIVPR